jgi:hypothetical protein
VDDVVCGACCCCAVVNIKKYLDCNRISDIDLSFRLYYIIGFSIECHDTTIKA